MISLNWFCVSSFLSIKSFGKLSSSLFNKIWCKYLEAVILGSPFDIFSLYVFKYLLFNCKCFSWREDCFVGIFPGIFAIWARLDKVLTLTLPFNGFVLILLLSTITLDLTVLFWLGFPFIIFEVFLSLFFWFLFALFLLIWLFCSFLLRFNLYFISFSLKNLLKIPLFIVCWMLYLVNGSLSNKFSIIKFINFWL